VQSDKGEEEGFFLVQSVPQGLEKRGLIQSESSCTPPAQSMKSVKKIKIREEVVKMVTLDVTAKLKMFVDACC